MGMLEADLILSLEKVCQLLLPKVCISILFVLLFTIWSNLLSHLICQMYSPVPHQENGCDCGVFVCRYAYNLYIMRHHRFTWKGYEDSFTSLITNSPAFQFDMFEIARIRKEMTTLVDNLSKVYLRWLKEQELADRTDDVNPVMPNHNNNSNRRGSISS